MAKDSTVKELDQLHKQARTARARLEPEWYLCLAYFNNSQWMAWDGRQLYRPQMGKGKITVVDNRITPVVNTEIAKMTKNNPTFTVTPRSADEEDSNAAELGEEVMRYLWKHLHLPELTLKALRWSRITGAGFLKTFWDPSVGDSQEVLVGPDGNVLSNPNGGGVMRPGELPPLPNVAVKRISQGDIRVEVRSPFQMFIDPLADSFSEAEWAIEESVKSADYVERRYGVRLEPDTPANPGLLEARMGAISSLPGTGAGGYKGIKVREYWSRPTSEHPQGRRAVWAKNKMLLEDGKPFDPMPYIMLSGVPTPGRLWPMSIVELLRGPQTELNKVKSQIAENRNRVGNPTVLASKQAVQDPDKFTQSTTQPGGVYFFDDIGTQNAVPKYLEAPPLPEYVVDEIKRIEESIQEISGQHEVTSAQVPPGVTAASAINLLQESDDTRLGPAMRDYEDQLGALGQKLLNLVARYYTDARTIRLGGENGAWQIFDFRGAMLRDNTQVEVQAGSAFPQSKAEKQANAIDLLNYMAQSGNGLQGRELAQFLKAYEVGGAESLVSGLTVDETQANRENILLAQGQPVKVNDYDNNEVHVATHEDFQKQPRYAQLPPQIQQAFAAHVAEQKDRLDQDQSQQAEQQAQATGKPSPDQMAQQQQLEQAQQQQELQAKQQQSQQDLEGKASQQQLDAAQAQQQLELKGAQQAQQQGFTQAQSAQSQRQTEELHQQKLRHAEEQHQSRLAQQAEQARVQAELQRRQSQQQRKTSRSKPNDRRAA